MDDPSLVAFADAPIATAEPAEPVKPSFPAFATAAEPIAIEF